MGNSALLLLAGQGLRLNEFIVLMICVSAL